MDSVVQKRSQLLHRMAPIPMAPSRKRINAPPPPLDQFSALSRNSAFAKIHRVAQRAAENHPLQISEIIDKSLSFRLQLETILRASPEQALSTALDVVCVDLACRAYGVTPSSHVLVSASCLRPEEYCRAFRVACGLVGMDPTQKPGKADIMSQIALQFGLSGSLSALRLLDRAERVSPGWKQGETRAKQKLSLSPVWCAAALVVSGSGTNSRHSTSLVSELALELRLEKKVLTKTVSYLLKIKAGKGVRKPGSPEKTTMQSTEMKQADLPGLLKLTVPSDPVITPSVPVAEPWPEPEPKVPPRRMTATHAGSGGSRVGLSTFEQWKARILKRE